MTEYHVSAPGKIMLAGEYAVLEGAPALVAAVSARAYARTNADATNVVVDSKELFFGEHKLGLGSSAATAVAMAALLEARAGASLEEPSVRARIERAAMLSHRAISPNGSGADVAASTWGGVLRFTRRDDGTTEQHAASLPAGLAFRIVWTGEIARTHVLIDAAHALKESDPESYDARIASVQEAATTMLRAIERNSTEKWLVGVRAHHEALALLGRAADVVIVTAQLQAVATLAARFGGAAKPSGAGGGDIAVAFFTSEADACAFEAALPRGLTHIPLGLDASGVRLERAKNSL